MNLPTALLNVLTPRSYRDPRYRLVPSPGIHALEKRLVAQTRSLLQLLSVISPCSLRHRQMMPAALSISACIVNLGRRPSI